MLVSINFSLMDTSGTSIQFITEGTLLKDASKKMLSFTEQTEAALHNVIEISQNKIFIKRTGLIDMDLEIDPSKETLFYLKTGEGFEVSMRCITSNLRLEDELIEAIYQTEIDREHGIHHRLRIEYRPLKK